MNNYIYKPQYLYKEKKMILYNGEKLKLGKDRTENNTQMSFEEIIVAQLSRQKSEIFIMN